MVMGSRINYTRRIYTIYLFYSFFSWIYFSRFYSSDISLFSLADSIIPGYNVSFGGLFIHSFIHFLKIKMFALLTLFSNNSISEYKKEKKRKRIFLFISYIQNMILVFFFSFNFFFLSSGQHTGSNKSWHSGWSKYIYIYFSISSRNTIRSWVSLLPKVASSAWRWGGKKRKNCHHGLLTTQCFCW